MKERSSRAVTADRFNSIARDANWFVINHAAVKSENMISRTCFVIYLCILRQFVSAYVFFEYRSLILQDRYSKTQCATWIFLQLII